MLDHSSGAWSSSVPAAWSQLIQLWFLLPAWDANHSPYGATEPSTLHRWLGPLHQLSILCFYSFLRRLSWSGWASLAHCHVSQHCMLVLQNSGRIGHHLGNLTDWVFPSVHALFVRLSPSRTFVLPPPWRCHRRGITVPHRCSFPKVSNPISTTSRHLPWVMRHRRWLCEGGTGSVG